MHLTIPIPSSWSLTRRRDRTVATLPAEGEPDALMEWGALEILPDEQRAWVKGALHSEVPGTARVDVKSDETIATESGWPLRLVEAQIIGSEGALLECRMFAFYAFFEHAATASFRSRRAERYAAERDNARALFIKARPTWSAVASIAELFDVSPQVKRAARPEPTPAAEPAEPREPRNRVERFVLEANGAGPDKLREVLGSVTEAIAEGGGDQVALELLCSRLHAALSEGDEALAALDRASGLGADAAEIAYRRGMILVGLDREDEAIAAWNEAAAADPHDIDALYNVGLAHYKRGELEAALDAWSEAFERSPEDFWLARKVIQAEFGLGKYDEAAKTRERLLAIWKSSADPAVQLADEFVFDQFEVAVQGRSVTVHASETLRPRDPSSYSMFTFRVEPDHDHDHGNGKRGDAKISVQIETSDYAKSRGVPYVISILGPKGYKVLGTSETLPPYPELRRSVEELLTKALGG